MIKNSQAKKSKGQILSFIPTGEYYFNKGLKAFHHRDYKSSLKYFNRALQLDPGDPIIVCQLAIVYTELGDYKKAIELLHSILEELDPEMDMVECHYFLANNYAHLGYFKDAYSHATLYLDLEPDGEFVEEAEELLEILSLETDEIDEELYEQDDLINKQENARQLLEAGKFEEAIEILTEVVEEFPEYWSAYNNLALAHFYLGEVKKANDFLELVMERNPGNLHALCNKLVFAYFQKQEKEVQELIEGLKKVNPISWEHQFKLGATFALIGEYEPAYRWFRKLYKLGYAGDGPYYYWFSYSAYFTGNEQTARKLWDKVVEISPEREGLEPWNKSLNKTEGLEDQDEAIIEKLDSEYMEERLFALFLISLSEQKETLLSAKELVNNTIFSSIERQYLSMVKAESKVENEQLIVAHETAEILYEQHQPIGTVESGLYLLWFSVSIEMIKEKVLINNKKALAAAIVYLWKKLRNEKYSQKKAAQEYGLSASTLQKYVKLINGYLQ